jgi:hypothetical protein
MRAIAVAAALIAASVPAAAAPLEIELAGGAGKVIDGNYPVAPVAALRFGTGALGLHPGFRLFAAIGQTGTSSSGSGPGQSGYQAFAALIDIRYIGWLGYASAGAGVAQVFSLQRPQDSASPLSSNPNVVFQVAAGPRISTYPRLGLEAGLTAFNGLRRDVPEQNGRLVLGGHLLLTFGFGG